MRRFTSILLVASLIMQTSPVFAQLQGLSLMGSTFDGNSGGIVVDPTKNTVQGQTQTGAIVVDPSAVVIQGQTQTGAITHSDPKLTIQPDPKTNVYQYPVSPSGLPFYANGYAFMSLQEYMNGGAQTQQMNANDYRIAELRMKQEHEKAMLRMQMEAQQASDDRKWQMYQDQIAREEEARKREQKQQQTMAFATMFGMMIPMIVAASSNR